MDSISFLDFFHPLPAGKINGGYLEAGEFTGGSYQFEAQVPFYLGPDHQVWALVGAVEEIPEQTEDQAERANRILDEAEEALGVCSLARARALRLGWAVPQTIAEFLFWLEEECVEQESAGGDQSFTSALKGIAGELRALGYQPAPAPWQIQTAHPKGCAPKATASQMAQAILARLERAPAEVIFSVRNQDVAHVLAENLLEREVDFDELSGDILDDLFQTCMVAVRELDGCQPARACLNRAWDRQTCCGPENEPDEGPLVEQYENSARLGEDGWLEAAYEDRTYEDY